MPERLAQSMANKAEPIFEGMGYAPRGIKWIKEHPEVFNQKFLPAFATVIRDVNKLVTSPDLPDYL